MVARNLAEQLYMRLQAEFAHHPLQRPSFWTFSGDQAEKVCALIFQTPAGADKKGVVFDRLQSPHRQHHLA